MIRKNINILIACEESQEETMAFRSLGFNAWSCDIQPCKKGTPAAWHIIADVTPFLQGVTTFRTQDGKRHSLRQWHFILAHPPCTYICKISSVQLWRNHVLDESRLEKMKEAVKFFKMCLDARADFVAVENPLPMKRALLPKRLATLVLPGSVLNTQKKPFIGRKTCHHSFQRLLTRIPNHMLDVQEENIGLGHSHSLLKQ